MASDTLSDEQQAALFERVRRRCERMQVWNQRQDARQKHLFRDRSMDPQVGPVDERGNPVKGSPFENIERYQHIGAFRNAQRLVARLVENHWIADVVAPEKGNASVKSAANDASVILNSWGIDIEERTEMPFQQAMSWGQCRAPYAVMHYCRAEQKWPDLEYQWVDEIPKGREKDFGEYEGGDKPYRETGDAYMERRNRAYAKAGPPWHVQFIDPLNFVPDFDNDPAGGLKRGIIHFDVSLDDYDDALGRKDMAKATALYHAAPAPGVETGDASAYSFITPSSGDYQDRVHVWQVWEREMYYEWCSDGALADRSKAKLVKCFEHGYGRVPIRIVPAWDTGHPDPLWRYQGALDAELFVKPYWDRLYTFFGAIVELTAIPLIQQSYEPGKAPLLTDEGQPGQGATTDGHIPSGAKMEQLAISLPPSAPQFLNALSEQLGEARVDTGQAEIGATTAPWAARLAQSQANVEPRQFLNQQVAAIQWLMQGILDWHQANNEDMVAFARDEKTRRIDKSKVIVVKPSEVDFDLFDVAVNISPTSSAEQITEVEHKRGWATPGPNGEPPILLLTEVYEAMGKRDPEAYGRELVAYQTVEPMIQQIVQAQIAYQFGTQTTATLYGPNGEFLKALGGQAMDPRQVIQQNGWRPAMQPPNTPGGVVPGQQMPTGHGGMGPAMPQMPGLSVPGQTVLPGVQ